MSDPLPLRKLVLGFLSFLLTLALLTTTACRKAATWSDTSTHKSGFVTANGIRLHYLDWGGSGPVLILIHGYGDNPHVFDDLAPAFTDRFRVIAYARRGHGQSDAKGPYDTATLTEDLRGLMDGLGIAKADLAGWSMGGNEITAMAGSHPDRVDRIVYLDAAYDFADPAFVTAFKAIPPVYMTPPASAMASLDAWRAYQKTFWFPGVSDPSRLEAYIRGLVAVQPDGTVRPAMSDSASEALAATLLTDHRDYTKVRSPALAIYAQTMVDVRHGEAAQAATNLAWEQKYMAPFRAASVERVRRELSNLEIVNVPGTHMDFPFTSREQVVPAMRRFLIAQGQSEVTFAPVVKGLVLPDVECSEFHSRFTGHDYHVYVSLPASYHQSDRRYPVLYAPDFDEMFLGLRGTNSVLSFSELVGEGKMVEEFILVGVPLKSDGGLDWLRKRAFDLTPTEVEAQNTALGKQFGGEVHTGGASMFLRTLKEELIPFIESRYRVTSDRGLAGDSFGGLFAAYVLLNDGDTFSRYLIGSPSLWWDNGMILKTEAAVAKSGRTLHGRVFLSIGADEGEDMVGPLKNLTAALTSHAYPNLQLESHIFEGENHQSVLEATLSRGLRFLYAPAQPKK